MIRVYIFRMFTIYHCTLADKTAATQYFNPKPYHKIHCCIEHLSQHQLKFGHKAIHYMAVELEHELKDNNLLSRINP
jgi:hypothetical protein